MALTLQQKLNDMVGDIDDSIDVASHMAYAYRELIDALPANLLAKHVIPETTVATHTVSDSTQDHRVVLVVINAGEGKRPARMETYDRFADFKVGSESIYATTKLTPVWYLKNDAGTTTIDYEPPVVSITELDVYMAKYLDFLTTTTPDSTSIPEFPNTAIYAFLLSTAIRIMQAKIALSVDEDEDGELLQLYQAEVQNLTGLYQAELATLAKENNPAT